MKLAILGGGGFRTPLVHGALMSDPARSVSEIVLHDIDTARLAVIGQVLGQAAVGHAHPPSVEVTTDLDQALDGADFVFSAVRVGGLAGRVADERVAIDLGLLGQETTGAGGIAYGLRTVPVAVDIAERVRLRCPEAWLINFTNPAGMITEAMQSVLGDRAVGICDTPISMAKRVAMLLRLGDAAVTPDYIGLNHLGWLRGLRHEGVDVLPRLIVDDALLGATEEGRLFGLDWVRSLGALPNEYLYYYYFHREAAAAISAGDRTRGTFLLTQQGRFYEQARAAPTQARALWAGSRREREETYMAAELEGALPSAATLRRGSAAGTSGVGDVGGYEGVALAFMHAVAHDERASMILNVRNGSTVPGLPPDAVVEVPCVVTAAGPVPGQVSTPDLHQLGLMQQVKAVERLTIDAARTGSAVTAVKAFALHPLVDSVGVARALVSGYRERIPEVAAAIR